jgi:hypothetical protein
MGPLISARLESDSKRLADIRRAAVADAGSSLNQKGGFRSDYVSNSSVELTRQEAADVETTLLACHRAAFRTASSGTSTHWPSSMTW